MSAVSFRHVKSDEPYECSFCLEEVVDGVTHEQERITHMFHEDCVKGLLQCPNCRVPVEPLSAQANEEVRRVEAAVEEVLPQRASQPERPANDTIVTENGILAWNVDDPIVGRISLRLFPNGDVEGVTEEGNAFRTNSSGELVGSYRRVHNIRVFYGTYAFNGQMR